MQETMQPGFKCSSILQESENRNKFFNCQRSGYIIFCLPGAGVEHTISPVGDVGLATGIQSGTETRGLFFEFILNTKSKNGKNSKTLRQNNAVLHRAALSGPKPAPDRAR